MKKIALSLFSLLPLASARSQDLFTYLADFKEVAYYGFADSAGNTRTLGKYNLIMRPSEGICRVWAGQRSSADYQGVRYGFCLVNGTEIIPPVYHKAEDFSEGLASVAQGDAMGANLRYGFVNRKGKEQIAPQYKYARSFAQGLAPVATAEKEWKYIDPDGNVKIAGPFLDAGVFSEGLAGVSVPHDLGSGVISFRKGYIDRTGKMVIQPEYNYVLPFRDGLAVVSFSGSTPAGYKTYQSLIDRTGKRLTTQEFVTIYHIPSEGLYPVKISGSSGMNSEKDIWGVIDAKGLLQGARFNTQPYFSQGLAAFRKEGRMGFMDRTGKEVIPAIYKNVLSFSNGLAAVQSESTGLWGFINKKGEMVIQPQFITGSRFSDGLAVVSKGKTAFDAEKTTGAIDKTGKVVVPLEKQSLGDFTKGRFLAEKNYIGYYLYRNGKTSLSCDAASLQSARLALSSMGRNDIQAAYRDLSGLEAKGCPLSDYWLGYLLLQLRPPMKDTVRGAALVEKAARAGFPEAQYSLGYIYLNGLAGQKNEATARQWFEKSAASGVPTAITQLGAMEEKGLGTAANPTKAAAFYQQAADLGEPVAMYNLALLYRDGRGVGKNETTALALLRAASLRNYAPARQLLSLAGKDLPVKK